MASFTSVLSNIGHGLKLFFTGAVKVAQVVEPEVDILFPGIAALYNTTVNAVADAETKAIAAGSQNGTGAQKLALVISSINTDFAAYAKSQGIVYDQTHVTAWVNAAVAGLNALPAPTITPGA
jgi:hypothetical protein